MEVLEFLTASVFSMRQEAKSFAESEQEQGWGEEVGGDSSKCESIFSLANT